MKIELGEKYIFTLVNGSEKTIIFRGTYAENGTTHVLCGVDEDEGRFDDLQHAIGAPFTDVRRASKDS